MKAEIIEEKKTRGVYNDNVDVYKKLPEKRKKIVMLSREEVVELLDTMDLQKRDHIGFEIDLE